LESHWHEANAEYEDPADIVLDDGPPVIERPGAYRLSGTLTNGPVTVDVEQAGLVHLILDGAHIASDDGPALVVESADEVIIVLATGSTNTLTDAAVYANPDEEPDAALFSRANLTITGEGTVAITGRAGDAIASKDGLVIAGGEMTVKAADDGLRGRDYVRLTGGRLTVEVAGDGLKSTNDEDAGAGYVLLEGGNAQITAGTDCVDAATDALVTAGSMELACGDDAIHAEQRLIVDGGAVTVTESYEGLEAPVVVAAGGELDITASDDGINAAAASQDSGADQPPDQAEPPGPRRGPPGAGNGQGGGGGRGGGFALQEGVMLAITGGSLTIHAGSDGIDSNGKGVISGGMVSVYAAANGMDGPFDIVDAGPTVTGGTVMAYGLAGGGTQILSPQSASTQGWIAATLPDAVPAGESITVTDAAGARVAVLTPDVAVRTFVYCGPDIAGAGLFTVEAGGQSVAATEGEAAAGSRVQQSLPQGNHVPDSQG
jgi:hypothetical protein